MQNDENLNRYEWIVVLSLIVLLGMITFITHKHWFSGQSRQFADPHHAYDLKIQIQIQGAVEFPGTYSLEKGATMEDALSLAKPAANADLKKLLLSKKIRDGQMIKVPAKEYITVYLKGAVEHPGALIVPKGTLMEELIGLTQFPPGADLSKLMRKRKLKEGETIKVLFENQGS